MKKENLDMSCRENEQAIKPSNEARALTTKHIDVTGMTLTQRHELFKNYMNRGGFTSFIKRREGKHTFYIFHYKNRS